MTLGSYQTAAQMRDVIQKMVRVELDRTRPPYNYASVTKIDRRNNLVRVVFPGDLENEIEMPLTAVVPAAVGQKVRVDGVLGDRFIVDVIGPQADGWPGDVFASFSEILPIGYLWADGGDHDIADYADLAYYLGVGDTITEHWLNIDHNKYGYWKLDETSGTSAADSSGNGRTATIANSPTRVENLTLGESSQALRFNGSTQYAQHTISGSYARNFTRTMGCWFRIPDATSKGAFLSLGNDTGGGGGIAIGCGNTTFANTGQKLIALNMQKASPWAVGPTITPGEWHFALLEVSDIGEVLFYLDDPITPTAHTHAQPAGTGGEVTIGAVFVSGSTRQYHTDCDVDEAFIISGQLSEMQRRHLYWRGLNKFTTPDTRGSVLVSMDTLDPFTGDGGRLTTDSVMGERAGVESAEITDSELPVDGGHSHSIPGGAAGGTVGVLLAGTTAAGAGNTGTSQTGWGNFGGSQADRLNMQPSVICRMRVKT
jgi:hypothetical protein